MNAATILNFPDPELNNASKKELIQMILLLRAELRRLQADSEIKEIIAKVVRQAEHILTFVEHADVPNHNNYGEYIFKKGILKRKVSGGSMSDAGVKAYAVLHGSQ